MGWRPLLVLFFLLVIVDGAIRKWVLPAHVEIVYFAKDAVLVLAFIVATLCGGTRVSAMLRGSWLVPLLLAYVGWVAAETFNPDLPALSVGALGVRSHTLYLLLLLLVPPALPVSADRRMAVLVRYVW